VRPDFEASPVVTRDVYSPGNDECKRYKVKGKVTGEDKGKGKGEYKR
jgi:hypothetical protein